MTADAEILAENRLAPAAALAIRAAIRLAKGREVCFVGTVDEQRVVQSARVAARGDAGKVLALRGFAKAGEMLIHNHPSGWLEPSDADLEIAARLHDEGIGFAIVDNDATDLYVVVEVPGSGQATPIDPDGVARDLGPEGPIARGHARFEDRPSQRALASTIARLYNDGGVGLLEAGTGVGKSMGYLVPALRWAAANGERTIVSTNTINLQEQLVRKDLPFLAKTLTDQPVRFSLLKGWRNYLCLYRLEQARGGGAALFEEGMRGELETISAWAERTSDGSLSDLPVAPRAEVWDEVSAEPDICQRIKCPLYNDCFLFKARREAAKADVIVVNHHLLLSDVAVRRASQNWEDSAVLPPYTRLVVDEGHHLEDAAAAHLGSTVTRRSLVRLFNRLDRKGKGLLNALVVKLTVSKDLLSTASLDLVHARLAPSVEAARDKSALLFDLLESFLQECGQPVVRLTDDFASHPVWKAGLARALEDTLDELELIGEGLRLVRERMEGAGKLEEQTLPLLNEMRAVTKRLQGAGDGLRAALAPAKGAETVRWVEIKGKERIVSVSCVPLDLSAVLREDLFDRASTTIVTSATLATDPAAGSGQASSFDFVARRLGLVDAEHEPTTAVFPSPFRYREQALLVVPTDVPAPNADGEGHFRALTRVVLDVAERADGGLFVLFTSHRDVRAMASEMRARGCDRRWPLLVHGEEPRDQLLARFRDAGGAVLLGTASFWEGVDVPGDALRGLVIAKLPFRVPTEPVTAAHCEAIEARGGNSFAEYMLPHASLRLKQGFGRLIRSGTDRGVVVLADPRVATKAYGRGLLEALPPARRLLGRWAELREEVGAFYDGARGGGRGARRPG
ncbi:MAG TPA: helicase C-terminal domain-containing protein [Gemmatimonadaceae bacterium]|nr:helicase C-terminal domain-containing protein [Gemmatimonadaceae bacterium]